MPSNTLLSRVQWMDFTLLVQSFDTSGVSVSDKSVFTPEKNIIHDVRQALLGLSLDESRVFILLLLGPFILVMEMTPAHVWLILLAIAFIIRSLIKVRRRLVEGILSPKQFSVPCGISFMIRRLCNDRLRFEGKSYLVQVSFFAIVTTFWLASDERLFYAMILSTSIGMWVITGIFTAEMIIGEHKGVRLRCPMITCPPTNYLSNVGLPRFAVIVAIAVGGQWRVSGFEALNS